MMRHWEHWSQYAVSGCSQGTARPSSPQGRLRVLDTIVLHQMLESSHCSYRRLCSVDGKSSTGIYLNVYFMDDGKDIKGCNSHVSETECVKAM